MRVSHSSREYATRRSTMRLAMSTRALTAIPRREVIGDRPERPPLPDLFGDDHKPALRWTDELRHGTHVFCAYDYLGCKCGQAFVVLQHGGHDAFDASEELSDAAQHWRIHGRKLIARWTDVPLAPGRGRTIQLRTGPK